MADPLFFIAFTSAAMLGVGQNQDPFGSGQPAAQPSNDGRSSQAWRNSPP